MNIRQSIPYFSCALLIFLAAGCNLRNSGLQPVQDPLPSWNEGDVKRSIMEFVTRTIESLNESYISIPDRIAVFDNDGTLWSEKPIYFQFFFALDRIRQLAPEHPEWKDQQPFKAALENDLEALAGYGEHGIVKIVMSTHAGMTTQDFEQLVKEWISSATHPGTGRPFTDMIYQPMLELIGYLKENQFKVFIVSGGGIEFMRPWVEEVYGIPKDQVIGSSIQVEYVMEEGVPSLIRKPALDFINDKEGKPVGIHQHIGRKPVFAAGNSDGDLAMLQWTAAGKGKPMMLYVHHTDGDREWAYDRNSAVGRLDKGLDEAVEKGWTVVDMKNDWSTIYPFQE